MPAPKNPNITGAVASNVRRGDNTSATRLRAHGWLTIPPETVAGLPPELVETLRGLSEPPQP